MSQLSSEQTRQILEYAKTQIQQKQFTEARRALLPIATHPTAAKWLAKLDEIAPQPKTMSLQPIHPYQAMNTAEGNKGTIGFATGGLVGYFVAKGQRLHGNWRSYGKPEWVFVTSFLTIYLPMILIALATFLFFVMQTESQLINGLILNLICFNIGIVVLGPISLYIMQNHAFKAWEKHQSDDLLKQHRYPWATAGCATLSPIFLVMAVFVLLINIGQQSKTYETPYFSIIAPFDWYTFEMTEENSSCASNDECVIGFETAELGGYAWLRVWADNDIAQDKNLAQHRDIAIENAPNNYSDYKTNVLRQVSIDGQTTEVVEFSYVFEDKQRYAMWMFFYYDVDTILEIEIQAQSPEIFETLRPAFPEIFRSIQLKQ